MNVLRKSLMAGSAMGALAVAFGALGAHALKSLLQESELNAFETAVKYQMYHALAIILTGLIYKQQQIPYLKKAYYFFLVGVLLFSGSIYLLSLRSLLGIPQLSVLGPITPLGGLSLMAGWIMLLMAAYKGFSKESE
jgi:uncharacterized membrane protein YgdD (TMEM256/DUF423 family)